MRAELVPVLRRSHRLDSDSTRHLRAATLREVTTAFRNTGLAAIGVGELEVLADALDSEGGQ
jgi:hypothetical protein